MCDEYTDEKNDKIIELPEKLAQELWFDMQWQEDKDAIIERRKQLNGLVKWLGI
jgi:hypothetical protein